MKKSALIAVVAIALIASLVTCTKEDLSRHAQVISSNRVTICLDALSLTCDNTIPCYVSVQAFEDAYTCLETEYETYNDTYEAQFPSLGEDAYDDQVESDSFNEDQPLDDWETTYYYTSLRTALTAEEDIWLANNMVGSDPFEHAVADFIFMTLINSDGDVKIGSLLYHFDADGSVIMISNGDCKELEDAKANPEYTSQYVFRQSPGNDECRHSDKDYGEKPYEDNPNRKFFWRIDFDSYINRSRAKTIARNVRYKNGAWRRAAAETHVYIGGKVWDNECENDNTMSYNDKTKKRKRVQTRRWLPNLCKIKTEEVQGIIYPTGDDAYIDETIDW